MAVFCPFVSSLDTSYLTFLFQDTHFKTFPKLSFIFDDNLLFRTFRIQKIYVIWQKSRLKLTWCFDQFRNQTLPLPKFTLTLNLPSSVVVSHLDFFKYLLSTLTDLRHTKLTPILFNAMILITLCNELTQFLVWQSSLYRLHPEFTSKIGNKSNWVINIILLRNRTRKQGCSIK